MGTVLRTGLYRQFDNAIQNMAYLLAVDQVAAGLRGVSVAEENALGREIAVIQTKFLLPRDEAVGFPGKRIRERFTGSG